MNYDALGRYTACKEKAQELRRQRDNRLYELKNLIQTTIFISHMVQIKQIKLQGTSSKSQVFISLWFR